MNKARGLGTFILLLCLFSLFATDSLAKGKKIHWSEKKVEVIAEREDSFSVSVSFKSDKDLSDVSLWVVPELQPYISVSPASFETINKGYEYYVILNVAVPADTANGLYDGTIHLKEAHKGKGDGDSGSSQKKKHHGSDDDSCS